MSWKEEFPAGYDVPWELEKLVEHGVLEDTSWRNDPAPSFSAPLRDRAWIRLWTEHPTPEHRRGFSSRYALVFQKDLTLPFGETLLETDDIKMALYNLDNLLEERGTKKKWRQLGQLYRRNGRSALA